MRGTKGPTGSPGGTVLFCSGAPLTSATYYLQLFHATNALVTSLDPSNEIVITSARTVRNLRLHAESNVTKDVVFTLFKNGAATTITGTVTNGAATGSDLTHTVSFAQGDTAAIQVTHTAGAPGGSYFHATAETS